MWSSIISLAAFVLLAVIVIILFARDIVVVVINAGILYFAWLAIYADITKRRLWKEYIYGGIAGVLLAIFIAKYIPLWWLTQAVVFTLVFVKIGIKIFEKKS